MDNSPFKRLPVELFYLIFSLLRLQDVMESKLACKHFCKLLSSHRFLQLLATRPRPRQLITVFPNKIKPSNYIFNLFNPNTSEWFTLNLSYLPYRSLQLISTTCLGRVYLWGESLHTSDKTLLVFNPATKQSKIFPKFGSPWEKHAKVRFSFENQVLALTTPPTLYSSISNFSWKSIPLSFPYKLKCPVLYPNSLVALCKVESQWKLHQCLINNDNGSWSCEYLVLLGGHGFAETLDGIKSPRLVKGRGKMLMVTGGLKRRNNPENCDTIVIRRLNLDTLTWEAEIIMPQSMFKHFKEFKYKVSGDGDRLLFMRIEKKILVLWVK